MTTRHLALLGSVFMSALIALGACGADGSGKAGTGGAAGGTKGGSGGTTGAPGGHPGTGGTTGAGGSNGCTNVPSCLSFLATCYPSGSCMSQTIVSLSPASVTLNKCYSNGVKESTSGALSGATVTSGTVTVSLNGTFCYSYDVSLGAGGTSGSLTFKNAAGAVLATVVSVNATTTTFSCGGQMYQLPTSCTSAVASIETGPACSAGTCP